VTRNTIVNKTTQRDKKAGNKEHIVDEALVGNRLMSVLYFVNINKIISFCFAKKN